MKSQSRAVKTRSGNVCRTRDTFPLRPVALGVMLALCEVASGNPTAPKVVAGAATFQTSGSTLSVVNAPGTIVNWGAFSIGAGETTRFLQQSAASAVLNRVVGPDGSSILGTLSSNGRVFLVNPNGIIFGPGARIDTAAFIASTLNIADSDFLQGRLKFEGGGNGILRNEGAIRASGDILLVGPQIENAGLIRSDNGSVLLAAGQKLTITSPDAQGVKFELQAPSDSALNVGAMHARNAVGMFAGTLRHSGDISVTTATGEGGRVALVAQKDATIDKDSTISASGLTGGNVKIQSGDTTLVSGRVDALGAAERGGTVHVLGNKVGILDGARIDASGETDGGTILVGGDFQGKNPDVQNALRTFVGAGTVLRADAISAGDGGKVIVWSDDATRVYGAISARGGARSGNGGFVETSGHYLDVLSGPDVGAPKGLGGTWLLDPFNITITAATTTNNTDAPNFTPTGDDSQVSAAAITAQLNANTNVTIDTAGAGTQEGNITVASGITTTLGSGATLTLNADGAVNLNAPINVPLHHVAITAGRAVGSTGGVNLNDVGGVVIRTGTGGQNPAGNITITATRGDIVFNQGNNVAIFSPGDTLSGDGIVTLTATAGAISNIATGNPTAIDRASILNISAAQGLQGNILNTTTQAVSINAAAGNFSINNTGFGNLDVNASSAAAGSLTFGANAITIAQAVNAGTSVSVIGDGVSIPAGGTINAPTINITTRSAAIPIEFSPNADIVNSPGATMRLDNVELSRLTATRLRIGDNAANSITFLDAIAPANISGSLTVRAGGSISQVAGATITVPSFEASGTSVLLPEANVANIVAGQASSGSFVFANASPLQVGSVVDFSGISTVGGAVNLTTAGALTINQPINAGLAGATLMTTGVGNSIMQGPSGAITAGTLTLTTNNANATLNGATNAITTLGTTIIGTGALNLLDAGGLVVAGPVTATGGVTINTTGALDINTAIAGITGGVSLTATGPINQSAAITQAPDAGTVSINAGANAITLTNADNDFTGAVSLNNTGNNNVSINDTNALILGASSVGTGTLNVTAGDAITQTGPITQAPGSGAASFLTGDGAGAITLTNAGNAFAGIVNLAGAPISITNSNALTLGGINTGNLTVTAPGISQTGPFVVSGTGTFNGGAGPITLTDAGNNFGTVVLNNSGPNNVAVTDVNALILGASALGTGTLTMTTGGAITQTGSITQAAAAVGATFNAGANAITLTNPGNDFTGSVSLNNAGANNVSVTDVNAMILGTSVSGGVLAATAGGAITQTGAITANSLSLTTANANATLNSATNAITILGAVGLGAGALNLLDAGGLTVTGAVAASGGVTLNTSGPLTINNALNAGAGNVSLTTTGASNAITQNAAGVITANTLTLTTANADAFLTATNALTNLGPVSLGTGALNLLDAGGLTVTGAVTAGGGISINTSGALAVSNTVNAGSDAAFLTTTSGGDITLNAGGIVSGSFIELNAPVAQITDAGSTGRLASTISNRGSSSVSLNAATIGAAGDGLGVTPLANTVIQAASTGSAFLEQTAGNALTSTYTFIGQLPGSTLGLSAANGSLLVDAALGAANLNVSLATAGGAANTIAQDSLGVITADTLTLATSNANATLNTVTNAVTNLGASNLGTGALNLLDAGGLTVTGAVAASGGATLNTSGPLAINNTVNAGFAGTVSLATTGDGNAITQNAGGSISAGTLTLSTVNGNATLNAAAEGNAIAELGATNLGSGALNLSDIGGLSVTGAVAATGGITLTTTGGLSLEAPVNAGAGNVSLNAFNFIPLVVITFLSIPSSISQTPAGVITAGTLALSAGAGAFLDQAPNVITNLGPSTIANGGSTVTTTTPLALTNTRDLTITGGVAAGSIALTAAGQQILDGGAAGRLDTTGAVVANGDTGAITLSAGAIGSALAPLRVDAGPFSPGGTNVVTATSTAGGAFLDQSAGNALTSGYAFNVPLGQTIGLSTTNGTITVDAPFGAAGRNVSLATAGQAPNAITQTAAGVITAETLSLTTVNADATLNTATSALVNLGSVSLGSGALNLLDAGGLTVVGAVTAGGIGINTSGPLVVNNTVDAGLFGVTLTTSGGSNITLSDGIVSGGAVILNAPGAQISDGGSTGRIQALAAPGVPSIELNAATIGTAGEGLGITLAPSTTVQATSTGSAFLEQTTGNLSTSRYTFSGQSAGSTLGLSAANGSISVDAPLGAANLNVSLGTAGGAANTITQTALGTITADTLKLATTNASATLNTATNAITNLGTVTLGAGALNLLDAGGLAITGAVAASGGVALDTSGALAVNNALNSAGPISLTTSTAGSNISFANGITVDAASLTIDTSAANANATIDNGTVTFNTPVTVGANVTTQISGTALLINGQWQNFGALSLSGPGQFALSGTSSLANRAGGVITDTSTSTLPIAFTDTAANKSFVNEGTFNKNAGSNATQAITVGIDNNGVLNLNSGTLQANVFPLNNGVVQVATAATLSTGGAAFTNAGTIRGTGTIDLGGATLTNSGLVAPGLSPGTLVINGDYTQTPSGTLAIEIGGLNQGINYDLLQVTGTANLDGTLNVTHFGGFAPPSDSSYAIMTFASATGDFATKNFPVGYNYTSSLTPLGAPTNYVLGLGAVVNTWTALSGAWENAANWSLLHVPTAGEDALINDVGAPGVSDTITVAAGDQRARKVTAFENLTVAGGGNLTLGPLPSTINAALTVSGGTLTANGPLAADAINLTSGVLGVNSGVLPRLNMSGGLLTRPTPGDLTISGPFNVTGAGSIVLSGELITAGATSVTAVANPISNWRNTGVLDLNGAGQISPSPGGFTFTNQGTVNLNTTDPNPFSNTGDTQIVNSGVMNKLSAGAANVANPFVNTSTGVLNVSAGTLTLPQTPTQSGLIVVAPGATLATGGNALTNSAGALIAGHGIVDLAGATLTNNGTLQPGGAAIGNLTIAGSLTQGAGGVIDMQLAGTAPGSFDTLSVTGSALLGGTLNVTNIGSYVPAAGDTFTVLNAGAVAGSFGAITKSFANTINPAIGVATVSLSIDSPPLNFWIFDGSDNWDNPLRWSLGHVPLSSEQVKIDRPGVLTITVPEGLFLADRLQSEENVTLNGTLGLANASIVKGALAINGGTLQGTGPVTVSGVLALNGGTLAGPGPVTVFGNTAVETGASQLAGALTTNTLTMPSGSLNVSPTGMLTLTGPGPSTIDAATLTNAGTLRMTAADKLFLNNGAMLNNSGTFDLNAGQINASPGSGFLLTNQGTLNVNTLDSKPFGDPSGSQIINSGVINKNAPGPADFANAFSNLASGTLNVNADKLTLPLAVTQSGTIRINSGATLSTAGNALTNLAGARIGGSGTIDLGTATLTNAGTLQPGGSVTNTTGPGTLAIVGNLAQAPTGAVDVQLAGTAPGTFSTLSVSGNAALAGTLNLSTTGGYVPANGDTFDVLAAGSRSGTFELTNKTFANEVIPTYSATGLSLLAGSITGNTWILDATGDWTNPAAWSQGHVPLATEQVVIDRPAGLFTLTVPAGAAVTVGSVTSNENINVAGTLGVATASTINAALGVTGTVQGAGAVTVNGALSLTGGTIASTGGITVSGTTTVDTAVSQISGKLATAGLNVASGSLTVASGGVLTLEGAGAKTIGSAALFNNAGTVNVNAGTLTLAGNGTDNGSYAVNSGTLLDVAGGTRNFDSGIALSGGGTVRLSGGTLNANTPLVQAAAGPALQITGGVLNNTSGLTVNGAFAWSGGTVAGAGTLTTASGSSTGITGTATLSDTAWNNAGTITLSGPGSIVLAGGGAVATTLTNTPAGVVNDSSASVAPITTGATTRLNKSFVNAGLFNKVAGSAVSQTMDVPLINTGTLDVQSGSLLVNGFSVNDGRLIIGGGATLATGGAALSNAAGSTLQGSGTLDVGGATFTNSGTVGPGTSPGALTIAGNFTQTAAGHLQIELGGTTQGTTYDLLRVTGLANLGGTLDVTLVPGFVPLPGTTFDFMTYGASVGDFGIVRTPALVTFQVAPALTSYTATAISTFQDSAMFADTTTRALLTLNDRSLFFLAPQQTVEDNLDWSRQQCR